jgi:hypothetical protein
MKPVYHIFKDVTPDVAVRHPYRIAETITGLDGPRTRLTNFCASTIEEAEHLLEQAQQGNLRP